MGLITPREIKVIIKEVGLYPEGVLITDASFYMRSGGKP